ncbi:MAG: pilus assembly protein PilP [Gammaproteobacteria bacterium]|nr:pilus assembly protein PilP [Gammaproteobacteria bacterium]
MNQLRKLLPLVVLTGFLLAGCGGDNDDLQAYIAQVNGRPAGKIPPLPEIKPYEAFLYGAAELRDPFIKATPAAEAELLTAKDCFAPDPNRRKEDLERFGLDSLKMVGTLGRDALLFALIRNEADGSIYRLQPGNYLGLNYGHITKITDNQVEMTEIVPDGLGCFMERPTTLALEVQE